LSAALRGPRVVAADYGLTNFLTLSDVKPGVKEDSMRPPLQRVLIVLTMVIVFLAGAAWANAQRQTLTPIDPTILSGGDIGFRMVGRKGNTVVGSLVVRVNGEWIPAESAYGIKPVIK
jgi:hypothetical protein